MPIYSVAIKPLVEGKAGDYLREMRQATGFHEIVGPALLSFDPNLMRKYLQAGACDVEDIRTKKIVESRADGREGERADATNDRLSKDKRAQKEAINVMHGAILASLSPGQQATLASHMNNPELMTATIGDLYKGIQSFYLKTTLVSADAINTRLQAIIWTPSSTVQGMTMIP